MLSLNPFNSWTSDFKKWPVCRYRRKWPASWADTMANQCWDPHGPWSWVMNCRRENLQKERPHVSTRCCWWWPVGSGTTLWRVSALESYRPSSPVHKRNRKKKARRKDVCPQKKAQHCSRDSQASKLRSDFLHLSVLTICYSWFSVHFADSSPVQNIPRISQHHQWN